MSVARFTKGDSVHTTTHTVQKNKVSEPKKPGNRSASGMPGYIKTTTDKSSGNMRKGQGSIPAINGPKEIPFRKGPDRSQIQSADNARGSMDKSYRHTSTDRPGKIRPTTQPMAPASRGLNSNKDGKRMVPGGLGFKNPAAPKKGWRGSTTKGTLGGKGTMERLVGKTPVGNITSRKKSMMY